MTIDHPALSMIEFKPDIQKSTAWMLEQPRRIIRPGHDDGYGWHALLAAAFGELAPKPFRLIERKPTRQTTPSCLTEKNQRALQLLAYTSHDRATLEKHARLNASPAVYRALAVDTLNDKPMPTSFEAGQHLCFEVRVRPTVRQDRDGDRRRSRERDAFLAAVDAEPLPRGERPELVREIVYRDWLAARFGDAARIEQGSFRLESLSRTMLLRPREEKPRDLVAVGLLKRGVQGAQGGSPDAVMQGTLTITDPAGFQALLARGIGRHLSFGYGMLLLRLPSRR